MSIANRLSNLAAALWRRCGEGLILPNPWHNGVFALFLAGILAYGILFAAYLLSRFDLINLIRDINNDDSFYYFQLARNLAAGQLSTFDGGITQTNGYHPLWMFLITPFYWFTDPETALFGIKGFEILLIAAAVALIALAARLTRLPWLLLFALLPLLYRNSVLFQGMEAAAALFMLGLFFLALALYARDPSRWRWLLAAVAFALPWVRLEYIAISLAATAALGGLVAWRAERPPADSRWSELRSRLTLTAAAPLFGAVAGILVYFAYNWLFFDGFVPVSGAVKSAWSQYQWEQRGGYNLIQNFRDVLQIPAFGYELLIALEVCAYALLVGVLARRSDRRQDWLLLAFLIGVFGLAAGHLAKFIQTGLSVSYSYGHYGWYFAPAYLLLALIIPVRCFVLLYLLRRFVGVKWPQIANRLSLGVVSVTAVLLVVQADFSEPFRFVDRNSADATTAETETSSYSGVQVMNRILPGDSVIGSWDSGVIGYFSRFPVVNLDGLVNSWDYARTTGGGGVTRGTAQHPFYQEFGLTHLANDTAQDYEYENARFSGQPRRIDDPVAHRFVLAAIAPPGDLPAASFDQLLARLEPHLDYRSEQMALLTAGRLAIAFAADCEQPELQNNVFFFSWSDEYGKSDSAPWYPQRDMGQNELGFCVGSRLLPAAAARAGPVELLPAREYLTRLAAEQQPLIRSAYDVYLTKRSIIYAREQCADEDLDTPFFLHLYPAKPDIVEVTLTELGYVNWGFTFRQYGTLVDGVCLVIIPRPDYELTRIRTGQFVVSAGGFQNLWEADTPTGLSPDQILARVDLRAAPMPPADYLSRITASRSPLIRSNYDVYLVGNHLIYTREQCVTDAAKAQFFLHLYQADPELLAATAPGQLEAEHRKLSFDNLDFAFQQFGVQDNGVCVVNVPLPEYDIIGIRTGQYVLLGGDFRNLWEEEVWGGGVRVGGGGGK